MKERIDGLRESFREALGRANSAEELEALRIAYLGKRGHIAELMKGLRDVADKKEAGQLINSLKVEVEEGIREADEAIRRAAVEAQIVTDKGEEITQAVIQKMERTTTVLNAKGGFSGEEKQLVLVSFNMRQYAELIRLVNDVDPTAFVTVRRAHEINGEGWTR